MLHSSHKSKRNVLASFFNRVEVSVDNLIQVLCNDSSDFFEFTKVKGGSIDIVTWSHELGEADTGQVTDSSLVRSCVLDNFRTEIRAFDSTQVLLVGLAVGGAVGMAVCN